MSTPQDFVAQQLERLRSFWPNLPVTETALEEWCDLFAPYSLADVSAAVTYVRNTYNEQGAPKPAHLIHAIRTVRMDKPVTFSPPNPDAALCSVCGTKRTLWDDGVEVKRNGPSHTEDCPRYGERLEGTMRADDLARFRAEREANPIPKSGLSKVGESLSPPLTRGASA